MRNVSLAGSVLMLVIAGTAILASQSGSARQCTQNKRRICHRRSLEGWLDHIRNCDCHGAQLLGEPCG